MNIGILTFHFGNNYGGILQCYALFRKLTAKGHHVEIINYTPSPLPKRKRIATKLRQVSSLTELIENIRRLAKPLKNTGEEQFLQKKHILKVFDQFRDQYLSLSPCLSIKDIGEYANKHYDAIIVGSDQVWTSLYDPTLAYFLDWEPQFVGKRISYAACSAHSDIASDNRKNIIRHSLEKFDKITVRDKTTASLVNNIIGVEPPIVPDPTELHDFKEFVTDEQPAEAYILTYILGDEIRGGHEKALQHIKKRFQINQVYAIIIPGNSRDICKYADKVFVDISPEQWVNMFAHATAVYTDSFHAIMFSLKFGIPFVAYYRNSIRASRLKDLKTLRKLNTIIESADEIPFLTLSLQVKREPANLPEVLNL